MEILRIEKIEVLEDSAAFQFIMAFFAGLGVAGIFGC
jgi:hypothetical protein